MTKPTWRPLPITVWHGDTLQNFVPESYADALRAAAEALATKLADADKLLETVRVAMGTTTVMEGLNVIDGLRAAAEAHLLAARSGDGGETK